MRTVIGFAAFGSAARVTTLRPNDERSRDKFAPGGREEVAMAECKSLSYFRLLMFWTYMSNTCTEQAIKQTMRNKIRMFL